jgi:methionine aminopeptidase
MSITIKTPDEIEKMRLPGVSPERFSTIEPYVKAGITTDELDKLCHDLMVDVQGCIPAPLNCAHRAMTRTRSRSAPRSTSRFATACRANAC